MPYTYDYLVFIGRFQPFHNGHLAVLKEAVKHAKKVIVLVGSANSSRRPRNPFTYAERATMIQSAFFDNIKNQHERIMVMPLNDHVYNDNAWIAEVQSKVDHIVKIDVPNADLGRVKIGLIGHSKDNSSYYLKKFPQWGSVNVPMHSVVDATKIRKFIFEEMVIPNAHIVPESSSIFIRKFFDTPEYTWLYKYNEKCRQYRELMTGKTPFPKAVLCSDNVVIQAGHILLIERAAHPGKGLLALPGGHVNVNDETFKDAAVRELKEETQISDNRGPIPAGVLSSFIRREQIFDDPYRSERDRVVTVAYHYQLPERKELYKVKGDDDAASARWYPLGSLKATDFFEDHWHIISWFTKD